MSQFEIRVSTQGGPVESAQFVGRVARLSRNVRQPDHVLANSFAGHKAEPRPGVRSCLIARLARRTAPTRQVRLGSKPEFQTETLPIFLVAFFCGPRYGTATRAATFLAVQRAVTNPNSTGKIKSESIRDLLGATI